VKRAAFLLAFALALGAGSAQAKPAKRAGARPAPHKTTAPARGAPQTGPQNGPRERAPSPSPPAERRSDDSGETATADASDSAAAAPSAGAPTGATRMKTKTYTFGAMDVEGKLKTPQLLYFLNRVKLELDMSAPDKRSFMKELQQSADDKSL
jgi:hypothetical protein